MTDYSFRLLLDVEGGELTDAALNALLESTRSEATFSSDDDGWSAEFDRTASNLAAAVISAMEDIERAGVGVSVRQMVSDDDTLVSASEMARRTDRGREAIRLYINGERNRDVGPFPPPVATFASGQKIWRWGDVRSWFHRAGIQSDSSEDHESAGLINEYLLLHRHLSDAPRETREVVVQALQREVVLAR